MSTTKQQQTEIIERLVDELIRTHGQGEFNTIEECYPLEALARRYKAIAESHERLKKIVRTFKQGHTQAMNDVDAAIGEAEKL
jgi:hypothetical protein